MLNPFELKLKLQLHHTWIWGFLGRGGWPIILGLANVILLIIVLSLSGASRRPAEPRFHLPLEPWSTASSSPRPSPGIGSHSHSSTPERRGSPLPELSSEPPGGSSEDDIGGVRRRPRGERPSDDVSGSPRPGFLSASYFSRFDDAMKLRGQLANEKPAEDGRSDSEEFDPFRVFRLIGSVLLAVFVRVFVCKYLVSLWFLTQTC